MNFCLSKRLFIIIALILSVFLFFTAESSANSLNNSPIKPLIFSSWVRILELFFVAALILYSFSIWSHKIIGKLYPRIIWTFGAGLAFDIAGTVLLCVASADRWRFTVHTTSGLVSLFIMTLHFIWALLAIYVGGKFESYFNRFSVPAWILWLLAFFSGVFL